MTATMTAAHTPSDPRQRRIWDMIAEPKTVTVLMTALYASVLVLGVYTLIDPSHSRVIMSILLITGGVLGMVAAPVGQWWIERAGLIGVVTAWAMHLLTVIHIAPPDGAWQILTTVWAIGLCITRWLRISGLPADPRRRREGQ